MDEGGRTAVVTGGNRGIGYAVAAQLRARGCDVALVARDSARGQAAVAALRAAPGSADIRLVVADLGRIAGTRQAAELLAAACPRIDVLVHNAGVWPAARVVGEDGLEQAFVTNHLAPFLLNLRLEPLLAASGARVVQVSAGLHAAGRADPERTPTGLDFHPFRTYADTKLCNLALLPLFAERWRDAGIAVNAVHPGVVRTGLGDRRGPLGAMLKVMKLLWKRPETGARPVVRLALAPELAGVTGRYFHLEREQDPAPAARDAVLARRLWAQAEQLTGLDGH
jgi:NAD(P)-dependent dehydrogenase (short-subunit alcohol dehydrogenase family)